MDVLQRLRLDSQVLSEFCQRWSIRGMYAFGSVVTDRFRPRSDVDIIVEFASGVRWGLGDLVTMEAELSGIVGRRVDLTEREAVERSASYLRRREVLNSLAPLHVEG